MGSLEAIKVRKNPLLMDPVHAGLEKINWKFSFCVSCSKGKRDNHGFNLYKKMTSNILKFSKDLILEVDFEHE